MGPNLNAILNGSCLSAGSSAVVERGRHVLVGGPGGLLERGRVTWACGPGLDAVGQRRGLSLYSIGPAEAFQGFWAPALLSERAGLASAWVQGLLERPTFVLRRGGDPRAAARLLQARAAGPDLAG